jgi:hypothetical protein
VRLSAEKRVSGDLKLLIIQKLLEDRRRAKERFSAQFSRVEKLLQQYRYKQLQHTLWQEKFSAQFSRVEKLLQQYRYKQPPTHTMASRILRPVLQGGETLTAVLVQTTTNKHYVKQSSPPSSPGWRNSCSRTGTNNHQHTLRQAEFSAQFSRMEKLLPQYRYKQLPTHIMSSKVLRTVLQGG